MSNKLQTGNIFVSSIMTTLKHATKVSFISLAWALKFTGLFLSKCGETIESIILKSHR
jgi:hypothetical protein